MKNKNAEIEKKRKVRRWGEEKKDYKGKMKEQEEELKYRNKQNKGNLCRR